MIVFWLLILSIVLMTLFMVVVKAQHQAWTLEAIRLYRVRRLMIGGNKDEQGDSKHLPCSGEQNHDLARDSCHQRTFDQYGKTRRIMFC